MNIRPAGDAEAVLWYCRLCGASGVLITAPDAPAEMVAHGILQAHNLAAQACTTDVRSIRLVHPNGWAESVDKLCERVEADSDADGQALTTPSTGSPDYVN